MIERNAVFSVIVIANAEEAAKKVLQADNSDAGFSLLQDPG